MYHLYYHLCPMVSQGFNGWSSIWEISTVEQCRLGKQHALSLVLLKTGSLDNAIREFSLAKPPWYMIYKNGKRMHDFWASLFLL